MAQRRVHQHGTMIFEDHLDDLWHQLKKHQMLPRFLDHRILNMQSRNQETQVQVTPKKIQWPVINLPRTKDKSFWRVLSWTYELDKCEANNSVCRRFDHFDGMVLKWFAKFIDDEKQVSPWKKKSISAINSIESTKYKHKW